MLREKASPELLEYEHELMSSIMEQITVQSTALESRIDSVQEHAAAELYQLELDRVKYLASSYLRTRLLKIQRLMFYLIKHDLGELLSQAEATFLSKYFAIKTNQFKKACLLKLPPKFQLMDDARSYQKSSVTEPNFDACVFVRVTTDIGTVKVAEDSSTELRAGETHLLPYRVVKSVAIRDYL
jgi:GINS complex subunit 4